MKDKEAFKHLTKQIGEIITLIFKYTFHYLSTFIKEFFQAISKRFRFSISFKMTVVYTLIFSNILLIVYLFSVAGFGIYAGINSYNFLKNQTKITEALINEKDSASFKTITKISKASNTTISFFSNKKKFIFTTGKMKPKFQNKRIISIDTDSLKNVQLNIDNLNQMSLTTKISSNPKIKYIQITRYFNKEMAALGILAIILLVVFLIAIIITAFTGWKNSKKMLLPIKKMTNTVKDISINALHTRLDIGQSHDELKDLAETFNNMIYRIQKAYDQQNQFVSDASHELRTPISVIQGYANLLSRWGKDDPEILDEAINAIKSESQSMKDLIEKLLFLARGDKNTQKIELEHFWVNELLEEIVRETRLIDSEHNIICNNNEKIMFTADRNLLKEALRIFVDNSVKYTEKDGSISISSYPQNNTLTIIIEDTGSGIPVEDIPFIFDRFYRSDKSRTKESGGTGLGLSIAKWIIEQHNGRIIVESSVNIGTKISIVLPCI